MEDTDIPLDKLVKIYRKIKMEIDTMTQEYDTKWKCSRATRRNQICD
jgi:hypothetical protein